MRMGVTHTYADAARKKGEGDKVAELPIAAGEAAVHAKVHLLVWSLAGLAQF